MSYTNISLGQKVEALSLKLNDLQREVAGLRQDVRAILYLLREAEQTRPGIDAVPEANQDAGDTSLVD